VCAVAVLNELDFLAGRARIGNQRLHALTVV
jgi:hypothetical protein